MSVDDICPYRPSRVNILLMGENFIFLSTVLVAKADPYMVKSFSPKILMSTQEFSL